KEEEDPFSAGPGQGYLPFPPPFHTFNVVMLLFLANVITYVLMNFSGSDSLRDFIVDHFTLSHENAGMIYPLLTNAFYQENLLQLLIDCWLLWQFGNTMLGFLGNTRMTFFAVLCTLGGSFIHLARQKFELYYGMDPLEVRGRCYGPNPFILGLIGVEGLIFRHLNFIQQPPVPFLVTHGICHGYRRLANFYNEAGRARSVDRRCTCGIRLLGLFPRVCSALTNLQLHCNKVCVCVCVTE
ncbi:putative rhomboid-like protein, putative,serine peptidase, Clan S-, family S54, partial [Trypanosoma cruzi]